MPTHVDRNLCSQIGGSKQANATMSQFMSWAHRATYHNGMWLTSSKFAYLNMSVSKGSMAPFRCHIRCRSELTHSGSETGHLQSRDILA